MIGARAMCRKQTDGVRMNQAGPLLQALRVIHHRPATTTVAKLRHQVCHGDHADTARLIRDLEVQGWAKVHPSDDGRVVLLTEAGERQAKGVVVPELDALTQDELARARRKKHKAKAGERYDMPKPGSAHFVHWVDIARHGWTTPKQVAARTQDARAPWHVNELFKEGFLQRWPAGHGRWFYATRRPHGGLDVEVSG